MEIQQIAIEKIHPYERNPRKNDGAVGAVAESIRRYGFLVPLVISPAGEIVAGHTRYKAAQKLGLATVPCVIADELTKEQMRAFRLADNKTSEIAAWDLELLELELADLSQDMAAFGFDLPDGGSQDGGSEDEPVEPEQPAVARPGELWSLGGHRLLCGDAASRDDVKRLMGGETAHLVFTDPPYGVGYTGGEGYEWDMIQGDGRHGDDLMAGLLIPSFKNLVEFARDDAAFYIWHASSTRREFEDAMVAAGLMEKQYLIWVKNQFQLGHADYHWGHEPCFYACKAGQSARFFGDRANQTVWRAALRAGKGTEVSLAGGVKVTDGNGGQIFLRERAPKGAKTRHIRVKGEEAVLLCGEGKASTAWEVSRETGYGHPTQKPVELAARAIGNSSLAGETVLDPFGGSGTTLVACEQLGRKCRMMEIDPRYCDAIVRRYHRLFPKGEIKRDGAVVDAGQLFAQGGSCA